MRQPSQRATARRRCTICLSEYEVGAGGAAENQRMEWGLCPEHRELHGDGFIAVIECDLAKSGNAVPGDILEPRGGASYRCRRLHRTSGALIDLQDSIGVSGCCRLRRNAAPSRSSRATSCGRIDGGTSAETLQRGRARASSHFFVLVSFLGMCSTYAECGAGKEEEGRACSIEPTAPCSPSRTSAKTR